MEKLIIAVGLNENVTREQNPNVALTPEEIAADVAACVEAGASIIHLHGRDPKTGAPRLTDPDIYLRIFRAIRRVADVPTYPTYLTIPMPDRYRHVEALAQDPQCNLEIAPIIGGSVNIIKVDPATNKFVGRSLDDTVLYDPWSCIMHHMEFARKHNLWVSHDIFEPGMVRHSIVMSKMGLYHRPFLLKFFMAENHPFGFPPEPRYLEVFAGMIPKGMDCEWLFLPFGVNYKSALACWKWAIANGGHVRVGLGDNPGGDGYLPTNAERIREIAGLARSMGREVATVADVRARFAPIKK